MLRAIAALVLSLAAATAQSTGRSVTFDDLVRLDSQPTLDVRISPDGLLLAAALSDGLQIIDVRSRKLVLNVGRGFLPEWSPDSTHLAFYSTRSGDMQLWVWTRGTSEASQVTQFPGGIDPDPTTRVYGRVSDAFLTTWSPDSAKIAFASRVKDVADAEIDDLAQSPDQLPMILTSSTPPEWTTMGIYTHAKQGAGTPESRDGFSLTYRYSTRSFGQIFVVDRTGQLMQLTHGDATRFHPTWSPDGSEIAYVEIRSPSVESETKETQVCVTAIRNRITRALTSGTSVKSFPKWSRNGSYLAFVQGENVFGRTQIRIAPREGGVSTEAFSLDRRIFQYGWSYSGDSFLVAYKDGPSTPLAQIQIRSSSLQELSQRGTSALDVRTFTQSAHGAIAWVQEDPMRLWSVQYLKPGTRNSETLIAAPAVESLALGKVEMLRWKNRSGEVKEGTLLLPPQAGTAKQFPLIVDVYTTRSGADWMHPLGGNQAWASMGYAVFRPSPRAPHAWRNPWKSEASSQAGRGVEGWEVAFDDVISGVTEVIRSGAVDPERMCLFGHSNGGNVAIDVLTRTTRFRCAVIVAPAGTNMVRLLLAGGWDPSSVNYGRPLEEYLDEYIALSPVFRLHRVETPVLLAAGDNDGDFLLNAVEIYNRLRARSRPVTLLRYPDQGHLFTGTALKDFWDREMTFFNTHLKAN